MIPPKFRLIDVYKRQIIVSVLWLSKTMYFKALRSFLNRYLSVSPQKMCIRDSLTFVIALVSDLDKGQHGRIPIVLERSLADVQYSAHVPVV